MDRLSTAHGDFEILGAPPGLRAWDAADEYLLYELVQNPVGRLVILNDAYGALTTALSAEAPISITETWPAHQAALANLARAGASADLRPALSPLPERVDTALIKVPKSLALLEDQLLRLRPHLHLESRVIGAGMTRHVHTSTLALFERIIGPTRTSLARKKARLIHPTYDPSFERGASPWPKRWRHEGLQVVEHAGVFSAGRLDPGTRLLLATRPRMVELERVVDLGCGSGLLGLSAAMAAPAAEVICVDQSVRAVASAKATFEANGVSGRFEVGDCLRVEGPPIRDVDLVLNNPPFHDRHALSAAAANRMFEESLEALKPGGELRVVANRHLGYHKTLRRLFGNCETVASNPKFVVLSARVSGIGPTQG